MFELSLLVAFVATAMCFLKQLYRNGFVILGLGVGLIVALVLRGDASAAEISALTQGLIMVGFPAYALAAILLAIPAARPGSVWDRRAATDASGKPMLEAESRIARLARAVAGALAGIVPAAIFLFAVTGWAETGDEAQLGFLAIPFGFAGLLFGAWVGYHWLPRRKVNGSGAGREPVPPTALT